MGVDNRLVLQEVTLEVIAELIGKANEAEKERRSFGYGGGGCDLSMVNLLPSAKRRNLLEQATRELVIPQKQFVTLRTVTTLYKILLENAHDGADVDADVKTENKCAEYARQLQSLVMT